MGAPRYGGAYLREPSYRFNRTKTEGPAMYSRACELIREARTNYPDDFASLAGMLAAKLLQLGEEAAAAGAVPYAGPVPIGPRQDLHVHEVVTYLSLGAGDAEGELPVLARFSYTDGEPAEPESPDCPGADGVSPGWVLDEVRALEGPVLTERATESAHAGVSLVRYGPTHYRVGSDLAGVLSERLIQELESELAAGEELELSRGVSPMDLPSRREKARLAAAMEAGVL